MFYAVKVPLTKRKNEFFLSSQKKKTRNKNINKLLTLCALKRKRKYEVKTIFFCKIIQSQNIIQLRQQNNIGKENKKEIKNKQSGLRPREI